PGREDRNGEERVDGRDGAGRADDDRVRGCKGAGAEGDCRPERGDCEGDRGRGVAQELQPHAGRAAAGEGAGTAPRAAIDERTARVVSREREASVGTNDVPKERETSAERSRGAGLVGRVGQVGPGDGL